VPEPDVELADLQEFLAIPYVAVFYSVEKSGGEWLRRGEYPELPDCAVEAETALEAMELLEAARVRVIFELCQRGEAPPRPRAALSSGVSELSWGLLERLRREGLEDRAPSSPRR
jgi:hypothetical protein